MSHPSSSVSGGRRHTERDEKNALLESLSEIPYRRRSTSEAALERHAFDALRPYRGFDLPPRGFPPDLVVFPRTTEEVARVLEAANELSVAVVPWGGGTGLMGGAVALRGGLTLDMRLMARVLRVDKAAQTVDVQAGATLGSVYRKARRGGLFFAHDPWTRDFATVGGAISTNGMGYYAGRYGTMGEQVEGLKAVLPDGTVVETPMVKNSTTGIDLKHLLIGTEGTLGVITEARLRCYPLPEAETILAYEFRRFEGAFSAAVRLREAGVVSASLDATSEGGDERCRLFLVLVGIKGEVEAMERASRKVLIRSGGRELRGDEGRLYWSRRHRIAEEYERRIKASPLTAWRGEKTFDFLHVSLPVRSVLPYRRAIIRMAERRRVMVESSGIWMKPELFQTTFVRDDKATPDALRLTVKEGLELAIALGGAFEYCHGVGVRLAEMMKAQHGDGGLEAMRRVKLSLDPRMILNPWKLGYSGD